jgi:hypothetical protein
LRLWLMSHPYRQIGGWWKALTHPQFTENSGD